MKRTDYCGRIDRRHLDQTVTVMGWVHRRRDHGGVIFVDLRDREGYVQVVCDPDRADMFKTAEGLRNEFCIQVKGLVRPRPAGTTNENLRSGKIEVLCHELVVLNPSVTPPATTSIPPAAADWAAQRSFGRSAIGAHEPPGRSA